MGRRVIADYVTSLCNGAHDIGPLPHVTANHEKCCAYLMSRQHFQELQRVGIIRPVVVGESNLLAAARQSGERSPIPLSGWRHRLIARSGRAGGSAEADEQWEHGEIVNAG